MVTQRFNVKYSNASETQLKKRNYTKINVDVSTWNNIALPMLTMTRMIYLM